MVQRKIYLCYLMLKIIFLFIVCIYDAKMLLNYLLAYVLDMSYFICLIVLKCKKWLKCYSCNILCIA
jgi:hypothetical protein